MSTAALELPTPQQIDDERKAAWLAERRTCITGTDIAAIFGLSKFKGPIDVWLDKKGQSADFDNDAMFFGRKFERPILEAYSERVGVPIEFAQPWTLLRVPGCPLLGASLDARWSTGDHRPVDAKNTRFKSDQWGESGSDVFPIYYQLQLAVQMMATGTQTADLAVCFSGSEFARYSMVNDPDVEDSIKERAADWWQRHIIADVPPEPDGSAPYGDYLKARFKRASEVTVPATGEARRWAESLRAAKANIAAAEKDAAKWEQLLKTYMGEASAIPGIATWKNNRDSDVTDWHAAFESFWLEYAPQHGLDDSDKLSLVAAFTHPKPGPRVFRLAK